MELALNHVAQHVCEHALFPLTFPPPTISHLSSSVTFRLANCSRPGLPVHLESCAYLLTCPSRLIFLRPRQLLFKSIHLVKRPRCATLSASTFEQPFASQHGYVTHVVVLDGHGFKRNLGRCLYRNVLHVWHGLHVHGLHHCPQHSSLLESMDSHLHWRICWHLHLPHRFGHTLPLAPSLETYSRTKLPRQSHEASLRCRKRRAGGRPVPRRARGNHGKVRTTSHLDISRPRRESPRHHRKVKKQRDHSLEIQYRPAESLRLHPPSWTWLLAVSLPISSALIQN